MPLPRFAKSSVVTLAVVSLILAACSDSSFDPNGTSTDVAAVDEAFASPVVASYAAAGAEINGFAGGLVTAATAAIPSPGAVAKRLSAAQYGEKMARLFTSQSAMRPAFSTAGIPEEFLGKTFEYDVETGHYAATDRTGAPTNGIRFILYSVNPITGQPTEPLVEIGYAQIVTTATASSASAQVTLVSNFVTYLDYTMTVTPTNLGGIVTIAGYATNGTHRADFNVSNEVSGSEGDGFSLSVDYLVQVPTRGFRVEMEIDVDGIFTETVVTTLDFEARGNHGRVSITGNDINDVGTYIVRVNGEILAEITRNGDAPPAVTGADGQQLTEEEAQALRAVFEIFTDGSGFFDNLTNPLQ